MIKFFKLACLATVAAGCLSASQITTANISDSVGTVSTLNIATFAAQSNNMAGLTITVNWVGGTGQPSTTSCVWTNNFVSSTVGGCGGNGFKISEVDGSENTYNGAWSFTNSATTGAKVGSIVLTGSGVVGFDMCWVNAVNGNPAHASTNNNGADGTSTGPATGDCGSEGTPGSNIGWTTSGLTGGNSVGATSAAYTNQIRLPTGPANGVGDEFNQVTLNFGGTNSTFAASSLAFTWRMDTDIFSNVVPEPATFGLVGLSLLALGAVSARRRRNSR